MSGQAGIYYFDRRPINSSLESKLYAGLASQGPDANSSYTAAGVLMAYCAFNFDDLSRHESQPHRSARDNVISFDGRLDNRKDLLLLLRHVVQEDSDPALALAAYENWGSEGLARLIGDWSVAIYDAERQHVVLASDYLGVRPLFYYESREFVAWSSSLALLVNWMGVFDELDRRFVAAYLTCNTTADRTIYKNIVHVPCGCAITFRAQSSQRPTSFWKAPVYNRIRYNSDADYEEQLLHLFREAMLARLRTDQVVCCELSGGLDSSSVTCMAHDIIRSGEAAAAHLITVSLDPPGGDDDRYISVVEKHCGIEGIHLGYPGNWSLDLPAGPNVAAAPLLAMTIQQARSQHSTRVSLTGHGGDLVLGNTLHDEVQCADAFRDLHWWLWLREAYAWSLAQRVPIWGTLWRSIIPLMPTRMQQNLWHRNSLATTDSYWNGRQESLIDQTFLRNNLECELYPHHAEYHRAIPSQRQFLYVLDLIRSDHALAATSYAEPLKPSHPFYHRPLVEFSASVPRRQLCAPRKPRDLMRRAFRGLLPSAIVERKTKALTRTAKDFNLHLLGPTLLERPSGLLTVQRGYANDRNLRSALRNPQAINFRRDELNSLVCLEIWLQARERKTPQLPLKEVREAPILSNGVERLA